jgi:hypothetical protein
MLANNSNWRRIDPNRGMVFVVSRRASLGTVLLLSLSLWSICVHHHHKYITKSMYRGRGCAGINWGPVWNYGGHRSCGTLSLKLFDSYRRSLQDLDCFFLLMLPQRLGCSAIQTHSHPSLNVDGIDELIVWLVRWGHEGWHDIGWKKKICIRSFGNRQPRILETELKTRGTRR